MSYKTTINYKSLLPWKSIRAKKSSKKSVSNKEKWWGAHISHPKMSLTWQACLLSPLSHLPFCQSCLRKAVSAFCDCRPRSPLIRCVGKLMQMHVLSIFNKHVPLPYHWAHNQYPMTHDKLWSIMVHIFSMCWVVCNVLIKQWGTMIQSWAGAGFTVIHRQVHRRSLSAPLERVPAVSDRLQ